MMRPLLSVPVLALALFSCGGEPDPSEAGSPARLLGSPAGEASGEPFLSSSGDGVWMSWLEEDPSGGHGLWVARLDGAEWSERRLVASSDRFFVNWADFPSVVADPEGRLWAHWLQRGGGGTYDYGVRVAWSDDAGATWSDPVVPHEDDAPQEHGFVSMVPMDGGVGVTWLDGREYSPGPDGTPAANEMTLRFRVLRGGDAGPETLLDGRTCDCCQTDVAMTARGPVAVYRDRSADEIRDIAIVRRVDDAWTEPARVHDDGWRIEGCPVNGPAVVADGMAVAVAWFSAAGDVPRVKVAFSDDAGATFGDPVVVDGGNPAGRVDLLRMDDGQVLVSWLERTGGDEAEVRVRRVAPDGRPGPTRTVAASGASRGSGFPRMTRRSDGTVVLAWTDINDQGASRVRVALVEETDS